MSHKSSQVFKSRSFPARGCNAPCTLVLRERGGDGPGRFMTHWRNDETGGFTQGEYCETKAAGLRSFAERAEREDRFQREFNAPAMVPQPVQQQQACAAPTWGQESEGITPRVVVGQTVHIRTRADWYAFASACRKVARDRIEQRKAGESIFWANVGGRVFSARVERLSHGFRLNAGSVKRVTHGSPMTLSLSVIRIRPIGQRHAEEMAWAARYRANAMRDRLNGHRKAMATKAVRACLRDAAALRTIGADAPVFSA